MKTQRRRGAPMSVQLVLLLMGSLAVAQVLSFAVIVLLPQPRPPIYRISEVATALRGGDLSARAGRLMTREHQAEAPEMRPGPPHVRFAARELAQTLGLPADQVRLSIRRPGPGPRMQIIAMRQGPPPGRPSERPPGERPPGPPPFRDEPIVGEFTAAIPSAAGGWTVVRAGPEPFPTEWQKRALAWLALAFVIMAPAGWLFARRITAPLKRFSEAAERLGRDPRAPQMTLTGPAEVGAAAEAFNEMQARLRAYVDDRTAMVGAISHDLRTPLARIRFKLERAEPALKASVLSDISQMEQMLQGVLAFIRDEGTPRTRERLDLLSMVECVVDDAALVGGDVELVSGEPVLVEGDAIALQRLLVNLVDNALKHAGKARVSVRQNETSAVVEILDEGPGLSAADLERVFQPFYRMDSARNVDAGGMGLGLPIARSTARGHGGDVVLIPGAAAGLTARVTLPRAT